MRRLRGEKKKVNTSRTLEGTVNQQWSAHAGEKIGRRKGTTNRGKEEAKQVQSETPKKVFAPMGWTR